MRHHSIPVNDALNKSRRKAGLPWQLWLGCVLFAGSVMALVNFVFGVVLLIFLPMGLVIFFRKDKKIVQLACLSSAQESYYDPGKEIRS